MITAVDTNILLDILLPDEQYVDSSSEALAAALRAGALVLSAPVYAELAAHFPGQAELDRFIIDIGLRLEPSGSQALYQAGRAWQAHTRRRQSTLTCAQCGAPQDVRCPGCGSLVLPRQHVLADFLIGAHALIRADRLLTRDRGYYRTYFPGLQLG